VQEGDMFVVVNGDNLEKEQARKTVMMKTMILQRKKWTRSGRLHCGLYRHACHRT